MKNYNVPSSSYSPMRKHQPVHRHLISTPLPTSHPSLSTPLILTLSLSLPLSRHSSTIIPYHLISSHRPPRNPTSSTSPSLLLARFTSKHASEFPNPHPQPQDGRLPDPKLRVECSSHPSRRRNDMSHARRLAHSTHQTAPPGASAVQSEGWGCRSGNG